MKCESVNDQMRNPGFAANGNMCLVPMIGNSIHISEIGDGIGHFELHLFELSRSGTTDLSLGPTLKIFSLIGLPIATDRTRKPARKRTITIFQNHLLQQNITRSTPAEHLETLRMPRRVNNCMQK
jgi:hypothetical protein